MSDDIEVFAIWSAWGENIKKHPLTFLSMLVSKYSEEFFNVNLLALANEALLALAEIDNFDLEGYTIQDYEDAKILLDCYNNK